MSFPPDMITFKYAKRASKWSGYSDTLLRDCSGRLQTAHHSVVAAITSKCGYEYKRSALFEPDCQPAPKMAEPFSLQTILIFLLLGVGIAQNSKYHFVSHISFVGPPIHLSENIVLPSSTH